MARDPWLEKYRTGSFRGVQFKTRSHTVEAGRRKQDREFAKQEIGNSEDLGKKLKSFSLELYVLGSDYFEQRDALEKALNKSGPGQLIHPYRGTIEVQAGFYSITETAEETRIARFTVEFSEAGDIAFPGLTVDSIFGAVEAATNTIDTAKEFFAAVLDTVAEAAFVIQAAADDTRALVDGISKAVQNVTDTVASVTFAIRNLNAAIDELIQLPDQLADQIQTVFDELLDVFTDEPETTERIMAAFLADADTVIEERPVVGDTPSRLTQISNQAAILDLFKELALATQAQAAVNIDFPSTDAALESRDAVIDGLDEQLDRISGTVSAGGNLITNDELFQAIKDLQTAFGQATPRPGTTEVLTFTPPQTTPAVVLAYNLFEDLAKENEIIDQNDVEHPGFVPGGDPIEVSVG